DLSAKAGAITQNQFDCSTGVRHGLTPSRPRFNSRRDFKLQKMAQDARDLSGQLASVGFSQALDLLGQILPIERQGGLLGAAQRLRLLLGPEEEILIVELFDLCHLYPHSDKPHDG